jgi:hypothetical protein
MYLQIVILLRQVDVEIGNGKTSQLHVANQIFLPLHGQFY